MQRQRARVCANLIKYTTDGAYLTKLINMQVFTRDNYAGMYPLHVLTNNKYSNVIRTRTTMVDKYAN